ncbi:MAG: T9SS type A sorting domain-containing protein [Bacteroidia bacterium]
MKKLTILFCSLILQLVINNEQLFATSYTWNGTTSTAWGTGTNWTPNGVPGSGDNVTIVTTSNQPVYDGVAGVTNFTMTSGTLNLGGYQLNITGTATFNGGTINNGRVNATGASNTFNGTTFGAVVWVNAAGFTIYNSVFNDSLLATKTGTGSSYSHGKNKFNGYVEITNTNTATVIFSYLYPDTFATTANFNNTGNGAMYISYSGGGINHSFNGNVKFNNTGSSGIMSGGNTKSYFNGNIVVNCTSTGGISFGAGPNYLASGKTLTVGSTGFTAGTLTLNKIIQQGTEKLSFLMAANTGLTLSNSTFKGVIDASAPKLSFSYNLFEDSARLVQNGTATVYSYGKNKFNNYSKIENTSTGVLLMSFSYPDTFMTKAVFNNTGNGNFYVNYPDYTGSNNQVYNGSVEFNNTGSSGLLSVAHSRSYFNQDVTVNCTSTGGIAFGNGPNYLATGKYILPGSTGFTAGTLTLNKIIQQGTEKLSFTMASNTTLTLNNNNFKGVINATGPKVSFSYNLFQDSVHIVQNGAGGVYSYGKNKFNGYTKIENTSTGMMLMSFLHPDTFMTTAVFNNTGNGSFYINYLEYTSANNQVYNGNVEFNNTGSSGFMSVAHARSYFNNDVTVNCTSTVGISFGNGPSYLAAGKYITVGSTGFTAGTLTLNKVYQQGTEKHTFNFPSNATLTFTNNNFKGVVNATAAKLSFSYNLFQDSTHFVQNGAGGVYSYGKNKFTGFSKIENTSTGVLLMSYLYPDTFMTKAVFNNTANGTMHVSYEYNYLADNHVYNGDVELNNTGSSGYMTIGNMKSYFNGNIVANCTSTGGITFGNGIKYLASGKTISIGSTGITAGTLTLNKIIQSGTAAVNLTATGSGGISTGNSRWGGHFTASAPNIYNTGNNKFSGKVHLTKTNNTANIWSGGNKFSDSLTLVNSGTSYITMANGVGADTLLGHVKLNNTSSGSIYAAERYSNLFYGNITASQNVYFANNDGIVLLKGSADQTFSRSDAGTTPTNFKKLTIDKTGSSNLFTLNKPINVSGVLTLTKGRVATDITDLINLTDNATVTGASNDSYVDGPIRKTGNDAFTFPVGKNGHYRKIGISAPSSTTDAYTAEYFEQNSNDTYSHSAKDGSIAELSRNEYWNLARTTGASNVSVTLSIDSATSCAVDNLSNLKVAAWDPATGGTGAWKDKGNGGTSGNVYVGTVVSSGASSTFGAYSLGTSTSFDCDVLPEFSLGDAGRFALLAGDSIVIEDDIFVFGNAGSVDILSSTILVSDTAFSDNANPVPDALTDLATLHAKFEDFWTETISGELGGETLTSGIYSVTGSATLSGTLTLTGDTTSEFVFLIHDSLMVDTFAVLDIGDIRPENIYWFCGNLTDMNALVTISPHVKFSGVVGVRGDITSDKNNTGALALLATDNIYISNYVVAGSAYAFAKEKMPNVWLAKHEAEVSGTIDYCTVNRVIDIEQDIIPKDISGEPVVINSNIAGGGPYSCNSGGFNLYFGDMMSNNNDGFDNSIYGAEARATVCAVFEYLGSIIDLNGATPDILINNSQFDGTDALGFATMQSPTSPSGFEGGDLYDHITTGTPPASDYDGIITIDFGYLSMMHLNHTTSSGGAIDLYSVILHEAMHALGFASFIRQNGTSVFAPAYSKFDQFLLDNITDMDVLVNNTPTFVGTTGDLISNALVYQRPSSCEIQPVYSPGQYNEGSSLSHFDNLRTTWNYVMRPSTSGGDDRELLQPELMFLCDVGYDLLVPEPCTNCFPNGVDDFTTTPCSTEVCFDVLDNDTDPESNAISFDLTFGNNGLLILSGGGSAYISGNEICYTPSPYFTGTARIQYRPEDATSAGNITSLLVEVECGLCPEDPCNYVCNGGMERVTDPCPPNPTWTLNNTFGSCPSFVERWCSTVGSPDAFVRSECTFSTNGPSNLSIPTNFFAGSSPGVDTHNGSPNDSYIGFYLNTDQSYIEGVYTPLIQNLAPNTNYVLDFWVYVRAFGFGNADFGPATVRAGLTIGTPDNTGTPNTPVDYLIGSNSAPTNGPWQHFVFPFTTDNNEYNFLVIEPQLVSGNWTKYIFLDDVRLVQAGPALTITKTVDNPNPLPGDEITFELEVCNNSATNATSITVEDVLPEGLTAVSGYTSYPSIDAGNITAGNCTTLVVTATVDNDAPLNTTITNCAGITSGGANCSGQGVNCVDIIIPATDIGIVKTVNNTEPANGTQVVFTITVNNYGPTNVGSFTVSDVLPAGLTYVTSNVTGGSGSYNSGTGVFIINSLNSGNSITLTITATASNTTNQCLEIENCASFTPVNFVDLDLFNNTDCVSIFVQPEPQEIEGPALTCEATQEFTITFGNEEDDIVWIVPDGVDIVSGQGTETITVDWDALSTTGGQICVEVDNGDCTISACIDVNGCCVIENEPLLIYETYSPDGSGDDDLGVNNDLPVSAFTITGETFTINGGLVITDDLTLDGCTIELGDEASIIVEPGNTLTITNSHLFACELLWGTIFISQGARIEVNGNSLIEDAYIGVYLPSANSNSYEIENATFNKNVVHIYMSNSHVTNAGTIELTDFLCEDGGFPALLNAPMDANSTFAGIVISGASADNMIIIGEEAAGNTFRNSNFGIMSYHANIKSFNNSFEDILPNNLCTSTSGVPNAYNCGSGIYTFGVPHLYVQKENNFETSRIGVYSHYGRSNVIINDNDFTDVIHGVLVRNTWNPNKNVDITNNTMTDVVQGVYCLKNPRADIDIGVSGVTSNPNTIGITPVDFMGIDFGVGVFVQETQALVNTNVNIAYNTITGAPWGIATTNTWMNNEIRQNTITVHDNGGGTPAGIVADNSTWSGIFGNEINSGNFTEENKSGIRVSSGVGNWIVCNTTEDIGNGLLFEGALQPSYVIKNRMEDNHIGLVLNNGTLGNIGGAGSPNVAWDNIWSGTNFSATNPNTHAEGLPADDFIIYYRSTGGEYQPVFNTSSGGPTEAFDPESTIGNTGSEDWCPSGVGSEEMVSPNEEKNRVLEVLTDTVTKPVYHDELTWNNKLGIYQLLLEKEDLREADSLITAFYDSCFASNMGKLMRANNAMQGWYFVGEMGWYATDEETMEEYLDTLENITTSITPEDVLRDVLLIGFEKYLDEETIVDSISYQLNSVLEILFPDSTFEALEVKNDAYSSGQLEDLEDIAQRCPFEYGPGVYMARAMLSEMDSIAYQYRHECEYYGEGAGKWDGYESGDTTTIEESQKEIKIYPNPANNSVSIEVTLEEGEKAEIEFWNATGAFAKRNTLKSGKTRIDISELNAGIYFYTIFINDLLQKSGKQLIVK